VFNATIQFVLNPEGIVGVVEKQKGLPFQNGKIQQPLFLLDALIMSQVALASQVPIAIDMQGMACR